MRRNPDRQRFRNEDLVLTVTQAADRAIWDESRYEPFLDQLCEDREYQKNAIRTALRYLLAHEYTDLRNLAQINFDENPVLSECYGSWEGLQRHLQFPDQLAGSLDLATGTGKSYVLYGLAAILLAEGAVDRVLVLCPSTTIEAGLLDKFRALASDSDLRGLLPAEAKISVPRVINASQTITEGSVCVENYHAILQHVGSSIRDSLLGKGARTAVLNDEAHHVANETAAKAKRWKEFLLDTEYGFRYIIGVSGTCYVGDDYFTDVIYRYSLRQAMEERRVKTVEYVADMPHTREPEEKWQLIFNRHEELRRKLRRRRILPLTIIVTQRIDTCRDVADELRAFLVEHAGISAEDANAQILVVYNNAPDVAKLSYVDTADSKIEWIVSVSMLNEGWDVKRVFQIVPHEQRAFNSKLLIAQVLGRALRVPNDWKGEQPEATVFNHDAWAPSIQHLVNEVLDREKRLSSHVVRDSPYHFTLDNIDYTLNATSVKKPMGREYKLFEKGYIDLSSDAPSEDVAVEFVHAATDQRYKWQTKIQRKTYSSRQIAIDMYSRLEEAQDPNDPDPTMRTVYTDQYPVDSIEQIVKESLRRIGATEATERMKQKFLQSLGTLRRKESENVRYSPIVDRYKTISTQERQGDSVSAGELRSTKTFFYTEQTRSTLRDEEIEFFDEATEEGSGFKCVRILNRHDFKTPLNAAIASSENEQRFIKMLFEPNNLTCYDAWIKSTSTRFYEIDFAWKKGEHPKRGKFNPDFFIKAGDLVLVIEIKGEEELKEPSEENKKKNEYALDHIQRVNEHLEAEGNSLRYKFHFLSEGDFNPFFQSLRDGQIGNYRSELDVALAQ